MQPYIYSYDPEVQHSGFQGFTVLFANGGRQGFGHRCSSVAKPSAESSHLCTVAPGHEHSLQQCCRHSLLARAGTYPEHHTAYGYNAIGFDEAANCWVQDVSPAFKPCSGPAAYAPGAFLASLCSIAGPSPATAQRADLPLVPNARSGSCRTCRRSRSSMQIMESSCSAATL